MQHYSFFSIARNAMSNHQNWQTAWRSPCDTFRCCLIRRLTFVGPISFFSITGADAAHVLSIASPMDTHNSVFPQNGASFTEAFGIEVLVLRSENGFEVAIDRSYGDMFNVHWLNTLGSSVLEKFQA